VRAARDSARCWLGDIAGALHTRSGSAQAARRARVLPVAAGSAGERVLKDSTPISRCAASCASQYRRADWSPPTPDRSRRRPTGALELEARGSARRPPTGSHAGSSPPYRADVLSVLAYLRSPSFPGLASSRTRAPPRGDRAGRRSLAAFGPTPSAISHAARVSPARREYHAPLILLRPPIAIAQRGVGVGAHRPRVRLRGEALRKIRELLAGEADHRRRRDPRRQITDLGVSWGKLTADASERRRDRRRPVVTNLHRASRRLARRMAPKRPVRARRERPAGRLTPATSLNMGSTRPPPLPAQWRPPSAVIRPRPKSLLILVGYAAFSYLTSSLPPTPFPFRLPFLVNRVSDLLPLYSTIPTTYPLLVASSLVSSSFFQVLLSLVLTVLRAASRAGARRPKKKPRSRPPCRTFPGGRGSSDVPIATFSRSRCPRSFAAMLPPDRRYRRAPTHRRKKPHAHRDQVLPSLVLRGAPPSSPAGAARPRSACAIAGKKKDYCAERRRRAA